MNMKSGTGDDPFAEEESESDEEAGVQDGSADRAGETETESSAESEQRPEIPYKFRRETVKEDRGQIQFFLRDFVLEREDEFVDELEDQLGEDVYITDAREAAVLFAMKNPGEVAEILREWGYDYR